MFRARCYVRSGYLAGQKLSPRKAFEWRPFSLRTSGRLKEFVSRPLLLYKKLMPRAHFANWESNHATVYYHDSRVGPSIIVDYLMRKSFLINPTAASGTLMDDISRRFNNTGYDYMYNYRRSFPWR